MLVVNIERDAAVDAIDGKEFGDGEDRSKERNERNQEAVGVHANAFGNGEERGKNGATKGDAGGGLRRVESEAFGMLAEVARNRDKVVVGGLIRFGIPLFGAVVGEAEG